MAYPSISVVIPVKNDVVNLPLCIEGILNQTVPVLEIIVIDSGSTDGSHEVARQYEKVKLIQINPETFNHGLTRNLGVEIARGDYVILTVQDARPAGPDWIEQLYAGFIHDQVAGVCGQQIVAHDRDKNPVQWFRPQQSPRIKRVEFSREEFQKLEPSRLNEACSWDDVTAMYKRDIKLRIPFREISFGEDGVWAKDALEAGYAIVYNPAARVYHYHFENKDFTFKRIFTTLFFKYRHFGYIQHPAPITLRWALSVVKQIWNTKGLTLAEKFKWIRYNIDSRKSILAAYREFMHALKNGEDYLEEVHTRYCGKPPVAPKNPAIL